MEGDLRRKKGPAEKRVHRAPTESELQPAEPANQSEEGSPKTEEAFPKAVTRRKQSAAPGAKRGARKKSGPSFEQIQLRAYFIGERRHKLGQPGNETSDWVQAERELRREERAK